MKQPIIIGVVVLCLGAGIYFLVKSHHSGYASDESGDENVPTVISVQTGTLKLVTLHSYVTGYGTIEAAPAMENQSAAGGALAAPSAGVVAKIDVVAGQQVNKDDVLLELNSATATFEYAKAEVERQKQLFEQQNTSQKNLQDAQAQLASLEIIAPVSGTVTRLDVQSGQAVDVNTPVAEVIDLNRLAVATKIPASQAGELKVGEELEISSDPPVTAKLSFVSPSVDAADGAISAWAALPSNSRLKPGQFVSVKIVTEVKSNCLVAPNVSVVTDEDGNSTISLVKGDQATQMPVQIGLIENDWTEISATNLKAGDTVATVGAYGLPDKTQIKIVNPAADTTSSTNPADAQ